MTNGFGVPPGTTFEPTALDEEVYPTGWGLPPPPISLPPDYDPVATFLRSWDYKINQFREFEPAGYTQAYDYLIELGFNAWYAERIRNYSMVIFAVRVNFNLTMRASADCYCPFTTIRDEIPYSGRFFGEVPSDMQAWFERFTPFRDYALELLIDAIINQVGVLCRIREWIIQDEKDRAKHRASMAKIRTAILIVGVGMALYPAVTQAYTTAQAATISAQAAGMSSLSSVYVGVKVFISSIADSFKSFLAAIHFDMWMSVHRIAYMVSADYRIMIGNVYAEISRVSYALGLGPWFLLHAFQNVRTLVLHTSAIFGREYDMAQAEWLSTSMEYLKVFQDRAYRYKDNPYAFFYDLEQLVERPAINAAGAGNAALILSMDKLVDGVKEVVNTTVTLRDDVNQLVKQLPENIRKQIEPAIKPYIEKFDDFRADVYEPNLAKFDLIFNEITQANKVTKNKLGIVVDRLKRPGDYISEIDSFDDVERFRQERQIADIASREMIRGIEDVELYRQTTSAELALITRAVESIRLVPLIMPEELQYPFRPAGEPATPRETWFIGEY